MKILSVLKNAGLCLAIGFAGHANASLIGSFSGAIASISPLNNTTNGDLAADIAADGSAPFNLGTLFTGSFSLNPTAIDQSPSPILGSYPNSLISFSIAGGDIDTAVSTGFVRITNNEVVGSKFQDHFQVFAMGINEAFVINGNTWLFDMVRLELTARDSNPSPILSSDSLQQDFDFSESTPWNWEQVYLQFKQPGLANSDHLAKFGPGKPVSDLTISLSSLPPSPVPAPVPTPGSLPLLIAALGLLGLRRRSLAD